MHMRSSILSFFIFFLSVFIHLEGVNPICVYLTWSGDPLTTMTIQWITNLEEIKDELHFCQKDDQTKWQSKAGSHAKMPLHFPYLIHRTELTQLSPDTIYCFKFSEEGKTYQFKTMPADLEKPIHFVAGGDVYHDGIEYVIETNRQAAALNPCFALIGGDIAYSNTTRNMRWIEWLSAWEKTMVTQDGCLIPIVPGIGNHDVDGGFNQNPVDAPFYYALFGLPGYHAIDFGKYLSLVIMDSGHTHPIEGVQTHWLAKTLHEREAIPHKFALYHVPAYPCVRHYKYKYSVLVRTNWGTLFEQFGLNAAFENHDHAYKRTFPLKNRQVVPTGVLYLGDGAWGVKKPRAPKKPKKAWYLAFTAQKRHFIHVILSKDKREYQAIDHRGIVFDSVSQPVLQEQKI
ncbi:putative uncharacterized protein [Parachlamydia acanthamoebae UV-7]|uniref:Purple acid phosphatase N-terminal domain-containing protein n=2 Tax=Parachlamydiaceae TaxID=92713 RepID=F8L2E4_PARAV|nr:hypothetical protein pah_c023o010 [Parachlamydia acanthamoebae str. Hall's coccus]CCB87457.1 putative uncharacterized protein [Parachlamydia acanthamoebae UV-7]